EQHQAELVATDMPREQGGQGEDGQDRQIERPLVRAERRARSGDPLRAVGDAVQVERQGLGHEQQGQRDDGERHLSGPKGHPSDGATRDAAPRSRTPNSPWGLNSSTAIRTRKNTNDDQIGEISTATTDSTTPRMSEATTAPPMLPRPPSTTMESRREMRS